MFEIYGRSNCTWCDAAKALLERKGLQYLYYDIENDENRRDEFKGFFPEAKTVPQILHWPNDNFVCVGTFKDLEKYLA